MAVPAWYLRGTREGHTIGAGPGVHDGAHLHSTHSFGYWVRRRRLAIDLTQEALARRVGCSASTIKKIERDERRPSRTMAERLAESLAVAGPQREAFVATALAQRAPQRLAVATAPVDGPAGSVDGGGRLAPAVTHDRLLGLGAFEGMERFSFVGRRQELEELRGWWRDPADEEVVLVRGEPGVGKTRLLAEFSREVLGDATVLYGRAVEGGGYSHEPVLSALRQAVVGAAEDDLNRLSVTEGAAVCRLVPEMAERRVDAAAVAAGWGTVDRSWLFAVVAEAFAALCPGPTVVVTDDLQWANRPAFLLLEGLIRQGLRVLGTCREPVGLAGTHLTDFLADLARSGVTVRRIELGGITAEDVIELITARSRSDLSPEGRALARDLHHRTGGHPLFLCETIQHLEDTAAIDPTQQRWTAGRPLAEAGVPARVADVIGQRLARLSAEVEHTLRAAAVIGSEFDLDILAHVLGPSHGPMLETVESAVASGLLREDPEHVDRYEFAHLLVHEVVLGSIGRSRRARLEWRAGESIETLRPGTVPGHAAAVARHYAAGIAVGDVEKTVRWALHANEMALNGLAYEEAIGHLERALRALDRLPSPVEPQRAELLVALGRAVVRAGIPERRRAACLEAADIARRADDPDRLAHAALTLLGPLGPGSVDETVARLLDEAATALRDSLDKPGRRALLAEVLARLSGYLSDERSDQAPAIGEEALELARQAGDDRTLALALLLSTAGFALDRSEMHRRLVEAAELADQVGDVEVELAVHSRIMVGALTWADRDTFDRHLAEYARVAEATQSPGHRLLSAIDHAGAATLDGRYADALEAVRATMRASRRFGDPNLAGNIGLTAFPVNRELGRLPRFEGAMRTALETGPHPPLGHAMLAYTLCSADKRAEATWHLEAAVADPAVRGGGDLRRLTYALLAETATALNDEDAASRLLVWLEDERPRGDCVTVGPNAYFGALRRYLGLLSLVVGSPDNAVEHHQAALTIHDAVRAPGWAARSRYDLARAVATRGAAGDRHRAAGLVDAAVVTAGDLGMVTLLDDAQEIIVDG